MEDFNEFASLSPLFRLKSSKFYLSRTVSKIGSSGRITPRHLIITNYGIFLIKKKSFNFQSKIVKSISYYDLNQICITEKYGFFKSNETIIKLKQNDYLRDIIGLVFYIRQTQFPTDILPLTFTFSDENEGKIIPELNYQPKSLLLDRTLSFILHLNMNVNDVMMNDFKDIENKSFVITKDLLNSQISQPLLFALAFDQDVINLIFDNISSNYMFQQIEPVLKYNRFIKSLCFINVNFDGIVEYFKERIKSLYSSFPSELNIIDCDIKSNSFLNFFKIFGNNKPLRALRINNCIFTEDSLQKIFQIILFNEKFHKLEEFVFENIKCKSLQYNLIELLCCEWALETKCIHKITVNNCGIDGSFFLSQLLQFDVGIEEITLNETEFLSEITVQKEILIRELNLLNLSNCRMCNEFLISLIKTVNENNIKIYGLNLSKMIISTEELSLFLFSLKALSLKDLRLLIFNNNCLNSEQTLLFTEFLEKQPNINQISLDSSINIHDSPNGFFLFSKYIINQNLNSLSMRNDESMNFSFGSLMIPILKSKHNFEYLDLTNQGIGQKGLECILPLIISNTISELLFDGSNINSFDYLCKFCSTIASSRLRFASFPVNDFTRIQNTMERSKTNDEDLGNLINTLKDKFISKFGYNSVKPDYKPQFGFSAISKPAKLYNNKNEKRKFITRTLSNSNIDVNYKFINQDIEALCCKYSIELDNDPISCLFSDIQSKLSLNSLLFDLNKQSD